MLNISKRGKREGCRNEKNLTKQYMNCNEYASMYIGIITYFWF
jgi:hypothetical protein